MLSPLIMYKPRTSCWTPSCKYKNNSRETHTFKCPARFPCTAENIENNVRHMQYASTLEELGNDLMFNFNPVVLCN